MKNPEYVKDSFRTVVGLFWKKNKQTNKQKKQQTNIIYNLNFNNIIQQPVDCSLIYDRVNYIKIEKETLKTKRKN